MSGTVWAVASGNYSDYSVWCICESKEVAEAIVECEKATGNIGYDKPFVEEFPMVATDDVRRVSRLHIDLTGAKADERVAPVWSWNTSEFEEYVTAWGYVIEGTDHERVRKAASDRLTQIKAEREGIA